MDNKYLSLYEQLDRITFILCNNIMQADEDTGEGFYSALSDWNHDSCWQEKLQYLEFNLKEGQKEFEKIVSKNPDKTLNDVWEGLSTETQDEIDETIQEMDYPDVYQAFIISDGDKELLCDYGQFVWYNEKLDVYCWGVMHYGTAWSHVMNSVYPVQNNDFYLK